MPDTQSLTGVEMNERARLENAGHYLPNPLRDLAGVVSGLEPDRLRGRLALAIAIGAGLSLDENIAALRALGTRAIVIPIPARSPDTPGTKGCTCSSRS
jgi:hypothetical protein